MTTAHGRLDLPEIQRLYNAFPDERLVSISCAQRDPVPNLNWIGNVYNAIDTDRYHFRSSRATTSSSSAALPVEAA